MEEGSTVGIGKELSLLCRVVAWSLNEKILWNLFCHISLWEIVLFSKKQNFGNNNFSLYFLIEVTTKFRQKSSSVACAAKKKKCKNEELESCYKSEKDTTIMIRQGKCNVCLSRNIAGKMYGDMCE